MNDRNKKLNKALEVFNEWREANGFSAMPITADMIAEFEQTKAPQHWTQYRTYCNYLREHYGFEAVKERRNSKVKAIAEREMTLGIEQTGGAEQTVQQEERENIAQESPKMAEAEQIPEAEAVPTPTPRKRRGVKRTQISVYIEDESFKLLNELAHIQDMGVSDLIAEVSEQYAQDRREIALDQLQKREQLLKQLQAK